MFYNKNVVNVKKKDICETGNQTKPFKLINSSILKWDSVKNIVWLISNGYSHNAMQKESAWYA